MIRWLVRELAETTERIAESPEAERWGDDEGGDLDAQWRKLRRVVEPWLADAEQRTREKGERAN